LLDSVTFAAFTIEFSRCTVTFEVRSLSKKVICYIDKEITNYNIKSLKDLQDMNVVIVNSLEDLAKEIKK